MNSTPDALVDGNGKPANDLESAKFTKDKDTVDVVQPTAKLIGLTKEQLEQYRNDPFWKAVRYTLFIAFWLVWLAMFVGAILIVVLSPKCPEVKWTQKMVNYKIFTLAYKDPTNKPTTSSGEDFASFTDIKEKVADLKINGISAIWPTPVVEYDKNSLGPEGVLSLNISSYMGGVDGFKELVKYTHDKGLKVIVDLPLTVATDKPWAIAIPNGILPGKAEIRMVNIGNDKVREELAEAAKRFIEYGVDALSITNYGIADMPETGELIKSIRSKPGAEHLPILIEAEVKNGGEEVYQILPLAGKETAKGASGVVELRETMEKNLAKINGTIVWRLGSLDVSGQRLDKMLGKQRLSKEQKQIISALFTAIELFISGHVSILYGEELGLLSGAPSNGSKKPNRIVYPWSNNATDNNSFFTIPEKTNNGNFESQTKDANSPLSLFKTIAKFHQNSDFVLGTFANKPVGDIGIYSLKRFQSDDGFYVLVVNWSGEPKDLGHGALPEEMKEKKLGSVEIRASTDQKLNAKVDLSQGAEPIKLAAYSAVVLDVK